MVEEEAGRPSADELEVRNVIARVAQLADSDSDDFTAYLSLWADDAVTVHRRHGSRASGDPGPLADWGPVVSRVPALTPCT